MSALDDALDAIPEVVKWSVEREADLHGEKATEVIVTLADGRTVTGTFTREDKEGFGGVEFSSRKDVPALMAAKVRAVLAGTAEGSAPRIEAPEEYLPIERVTEGGHPPIKHAQWLNLLRDRFGPDPRDWAFVCPGCGDVATGKDLEEALARNPRNREREGVEIVTFGDLLGQECIGRTLGALDGTNDPYTGRGCSYAAYGLIPGPIGVHLPNGREIRVFKAAPVEAVQLRTSLDETVET